MRDETKGDLNTNPFYQLNLRHPRSNSIFGL